MNPTAAAAAIYRLAQLTVDLDGLITVHHLLEAACRAYEDGDVELSDAYLRVARLKAKLSVSAVADAMLPDILDCPASYLEEAGAAATAYIVAEAALALAE